MNEYSDRIEEINERADTLFQRVGEFSTHFAGLELELLAVLAVSVNQTDPKCAEIALSQMSFSQCIATFKKTAKHHCRTPEEKKYLTNLCKRLEQIGKKRNEVMHSVWVATSGGEYVQHPARRKKGSERKPKTHTEDIPKALAEDIHIITELLCDLTSFCKDTIRRNTEQEN